MLEPIVVDADDVNRPVADSSMGRPAPVPPSAAPSGDRIGAAWLVGSLSIGLALGAVLGTVAALVIFG